MDVVDSPQLIFQVFIEPLHLYTTFVQVPPPVEPAAPSTPQDEHLEQVIHLPSLCVVIVYVVPPQ